MEKRIVGGRVGVVYSPGFGAGWSTWNEEHKETLCMDARIVDAVLSHDLELAATLAETLCGDCVYTGGSHKLQVTWLPVGTQFEIDEYDGSESVHVIGSRSYMTA